MTIQLSFSIIEPGGCFGGRSVRPLTGVRVMHSRLGLGGGGIGLDLASRFLALLAPQGGAATVVAEYRMSLADKLLSDFQYFQFVAY